VGFQYELQKMPSHRWGTHTKWTK